MNPIQIIEIKMTRLAFYFCLYLVPAMVALVQPQHWLRLVVLAGLGLGLWRSLRRAGRRGRWDVREALLFSLTSAGLAMVVACVSTLLGWVSLLCWTLVAFDQAQGREGHRGLAVIQ